MNKELFLIDFEVKGNVIRLYFGNNPDYWGDDWDDRPYECNAGTVYSEYVEEIKDYAFDFDTAVLSPEEDWHYRGNSPYCKEDFKNRIAPCLIIGKNMDFFDLTYSRVLGEDCSFFIKLYFGDLQTDVEQKISKMNGKCLLKESTSE